MALSHTTTIDSRLTITASIGRTDSPYINSITAALGQQQTLLTGSGSPSIGENVINRWYYKKSELEVSSVSLSMRTLGGATDDVGRSYLMTSLRYFMVRNLHASNELWVKTDVANGFASLLGGDTPLNVGGTLLIMSPNGIGIDATNNVVALDDNDGLDPISYEILVGGWQTGA